MANDRPPFLAKVAYRPSILFVPADLFGLNAGIQVTCLLICAGAFEVVPIQIFLITMPAVHGVLAVIALSEPHIVSIWRAKVSRPRLPSYRSSQQGRHYAP